MAALTPQVKSELFKLLIGMFNASPGTRYLPDFLTFIQFQPNGSDSILALAKELASKPVFEELYPSSQTAQQFKDSFLSTLGLMGNAEANAYLDRELGLGKSKIVVISESIRALDGYTGTDATLLRSKAILSNKAEVSQYYSETVKGNAEDLVTLRLTLQEVGETADSVTRKKMMLDASAPPAPVTMPIAAPIQAATSASEAPVNTNFNDTFFKSQWLLNNTGQRYTTQAAKDAGLSKSGGAFLDINVLAAWQSGLTGKGIRLSVSDDGFDLNHEDLQGNILKNLSYNAVNGATGANAFDDTSTFFLDRTKSSQHGTVVGAIATMAANNGKGMVGVSFDSSLIAALILPSTVKNADGSEKGTQFNADIAKHFDYLIANKVDVSLNSYGSDPAFSENTNAINDPEQADNIKVANAIARAVSQGRDGKGMIIEFSAGNERGTNADSGMTNGTSSRNVIAVGALDELGYVTTYGSRGANILVSAFGGETASGQDTNAGFGVLAADITGNLGYNTRGPGMDDPATAIDESGNYSFENTGTSYSGPVVGGVAALMLQANPNLGFRDVSTILALTARGVGVPDKLDAQNMVLPGTGNAYNTTNTKDWNLGGMHFSPNGAGFGLVDATAAVRLAEQWLIADNANTRGTVANWRSAESTAVTSSSAPNNQIPDNNQQGLTVSARVAGQVRIERMEFDLKLNSAVTSTLRAEITSPDGTSIVLFDSPLSKPTAKVNDAATPDTPWPGVFTIGSTAFLGENSQGTWTLRLIDKVSGGTVSTFESLTVRAWGPQSTSDSQYTFTREYSGSNKVISDSAGLDTLNAAAVHKAVTLNLNEGITNQIGNDSNTPGTFTIAQGTLIENAIGGGGADTITGNSIANLLKGSWGNDSIFGGEGNDTLVGGAGVDRLTGGNGSDTFVLTENVSAPVGQFLGDVILDFQDGSAGVQDLLQFSSTALARLAGWSGSNNGLTGLAGDQGASFLVKGTGDQTPTLAFAQFLYNAGTGDLALDTDGTGSNGAVLIGNVGANKELSAADFVFIA